MNKKALKEVGIFWLCLLGIMVFAVGVFVLIIKVSTYFLFLLLIPCVIGISHLVYIQSDEFKDKK